jgi:hypothetical protein
VRGTPTNDRVMTPPRLARALVAAIRPSGVVLEPSAGRGSFVRALREHGCDVRWCELDEGTDFLHWSAMVDEVVGNPPWSKFRAFLAHALCIARRRVAFICTINHLWTKHRQQLIDRAGFGTERIIKFDAPKEWGAQTGFQVGLILLERGWSGPCTIETLTLPAKNTHAPQKPLLVDHDTPKRP